MRALAILFVVCCTTLAVNGKDGFKMAFRAEQVQLGELPYQVSIQINGHHLCGGSLISERHVLTAAHCLNDRLKDPYKYYYDRWTVEVGAVLLGTGQSYDVIRLAMNRDYGQSQYRDVLFPNDVAVITLATEVEQSEYVKVIALPPPSFEVPVGAPVIVSGFGSATYKGPVSRILQKSTVLIHDIVKCYDFYKAMHRTYILSTNICTSRGPGYGTCGGDSGGPLVYNGMVVGIVSGGDGHCGAGNPDFYTKVSDFIPYIEHELNNNGGPSDTMSTVLNFVAYEINNYIDK